MEGFDPAWGNAPLVRFAALGLGAPAVAVPAEEFGVEAGGVRLACRLQVGHCDRVVGPKVAWWRRLCWCGVGVWFGGGNGSLPGCSKGQVGWAARKERMREGYMGGT